MTGITAIITAKSPLCKCGAGAEYGFTNNLGVAFDALLSFHGQRNTLNNVEYNQKVHRLKLLRRINWEFSNSLKGNSKAI